MTIGVDAQFEVNGDYFGSGKVFHKIFFASNVVEIN